MFCSMYCLCQQCVLAQVWPGTGQEPRKCHCARVGGTLHLSQHWNPCALNTSEGVILWIQSWHPDHLQSWRVSGGRLFSCSLQIYSCLAQAFQGSSDLEGSTFSTVPPATRLDAQGAVGVCPVGSWFSVLPHCLTLDRFGPRYAGPWFPIPTQQLKYLSQTFLLPWG